MDTNGEETLVVDQETAMGNKEPAMQDTAEPKTTYKSYKKKYRKMKIQFDEAMRVSNELYLEEQRALKTIKRLAIENDQILELLLDVNNSAQIPLDKRFDITTGLEDLDYLFTNDDLARAAEIETPEGIALFNEISALVEERNAANSAPKPAKSLAELQNTVPHNTKYTPGVKERMASILAPLDGRTHIGFITPEEMDDYLDDIDTQIGTAVPLPPSTSPPQNDLAFGNYHSPYNWLRRNQPHIFLQDGEGSEKSHGKPGALRGAGKRASIPAPSKPDALEIVEEDGIGYDFALGGGVATKGKRKRDEDDGSGGYHPSKAAKNVGEDGVRKKRPYNRKPKPVDGEAPPVSAKKGKGRAKPKAPSPDPTAHPFGPPRV